MKTVLKTAVAASFAILLCLSLIKCTTPAVSEVLVPRPVPPIDGVAMSTDEAMNSLESTYGISIGRAGQKAGLQTTSAQYRIKCRQPSRFEQCAFVMQLKNQVQPIVRGGAIRV